MFVLLTRCGLSGRFCTQAQQDRKSDFRRCLRKCNDNFFNEYWMSFSGANGRKLQGQQTGQPFPSRESGISRSAAGGGGDGGCLSRDTPPAPTHPLRKERKGGGGLAKCESGQLITRKRRGAERKEFRRLSLSLPRQFFAVSVNLANLPL